MKKREDILIATLDCFALHGIKATTTKQIATTAAVSEALIFKHFSNKQNLTEAVLLMAKDRASEVVVEWEKSEHPKLIIKSILMSALNIKKQDLKYVFFLNQFNDWNFMNTWQFALNFNDKLLQVFHQLGVQAAEEKRSLFWMQLYGLVLYRKHFDLQNAIALYEQLSAQYQL